MGDKYFLDPNIIAYCFDKPSEIKQNIALSLFKNLFNMENFHISTQVIGEFCNVAAKKFAPPLDSHNIQKFITSIPSEKIITIQKEQYINALDIKEKYTFSFWDSLIIETALHADCSILYSEDMQHGQIIEKKLKVVNPFI